MAKGIKPKQKNNHPSASADPSAWGPSNQFKLVPQTPSQATTASKFNRPRYTKPKNSSFKIRSFLRRSLLYLCPSCCTTQQYKPSMTRTNSNRKRGRIKALCCPPWNCFPFCCCTSSSGRPPTDRASSEDLCQLIRNCGTSNGDELDIDQYVARYRQSEQSQLQGQGISLVSVSMAAGVGSINPPRTPTVSQSTTPEVHKRGKKKKLMKHIWNWNDSLKSNSDKFLESLEYDAMLGNGGGGGGSKSNSLKKYRKIASNCSNIEGTLYLSPFLIFTVSFACQ